MITKTFIDTLDNYLNNDAKKLIVDFFIIFSRFECALKASNYVNVKQGKVMPNWDTFIATIRPTFNKDRNASLRGAVDYLIQSPPKIQTFRNGQLTWNDRVFQMNESEIIKIGLSIRDVRNNLFHGGKFNGSYQIDVSRNPKLLGSSIIVLNDWLDLDQTVESNFLKDII